MVKLRLWGDARGTVVVAALSAAPLLPALLLVQNNAESSEVLRTSQLVTYALVLAGAMLAYFHWRMASARPDESAALRPGGWLTLGLFMASLHGLAMAGLLDPISTPGLDAWPLVGQFLLLSTLIVAARLADSVDVPRDPALIGGVAGLLMIAGSSLMVSLAPPLLLSPTKAALLNTLTMLAGLLLAWMVLQLREVPTWARGRVALGVALLTSAHFMSHLGSDARWLLIVAVVVNLQGAIVLCTMCQTLLRRSLQDHQDELLLLQETLSRVRADALEHRELLHEVGSTVAGITTASRVVKQGGLLSPQRIRRLEEMVTAELARLDRLMSDQAGGAEPLVFEVDGVVEQLVTSHQARGLDVRWSPGGGRAVGDPDDLAEVVNILLENARRHGGGTVEIGAKLTEEHVELTCSDSGPGVADEVRRQLFTTGVSRPGSPGQGLGLSIARRLMSERGGSLELTDSVHAGATFVARLPRCELANAHPVA